MVNMTNSSPLTKPANYTKSHITTNSKTARHNKATPKTDTIGPRRKLDSSEISALRKIADQANENLRQIVEKLILKQGNDYRVFSVKGFASKDHVSFSDIEKARLSISEDGEFGVNAVSDRLVNFAISISGGDKTKLSELKSAIDSGFAAARDALGGYLPAICNETYNETMKKLDAWAQD